MSSHCGGVQQDRRRDKLNAACSPSTVAARLFFLIRQLQPRCRGGGESAAASPYPRFVLTAPFKALNLHLNHLALELRMNKSGTLWELLRFCLLLYDQSSKLKEAVLDVDSRRLAWRDGSSPLDGREICSITYSTDRFLF